jgi:hypothetical protein
VWDTGTDQFTFDLKTVDPAFPDAPVDVCFIDGFIVVAAGGTNNFYLSAFNNIYSYSFVQSTTTTFNSVTDIITQNTGTSIPTGMPVNFTAGGGLPPEIVAGTTYYAIFVSSTTIRIATTFANAVANSFINFSTNGTPPNTITVLAAPNLPGQL